MGVGGRALEEVGAGGGGGIKPLSKTGSEKLGRILGCG